MKGVIIDFTAVIAIAGGVGLFVFFVLRPVQEKLLVKYLAIRCSISICSNIDVFYDDLNRQFRGSNVPLTQMGQGLPVPLAVTVVEQARRFLNLHAPHLRDKWEKRLIECDRSIPRTLIVSNMDIGCLPIIAGISGFASVSLLSAMVGEDIGWLQIILTMFGVAIPGALFVAMGFTTVKSVLEFSNVILKSYAQLEQLTNQA